MRCDYCDSTGWGLTANIPPSGGGRFSEAVPIGGMKTFMQLHVEAGALSVVQSTDEAFSDDADMHVTSFRIRYCPMCGRRLA